MHILLEDATFMAQNRLAAETSPYLLQHKDNPVAWQPWGQAAFDLARGDDKPILLSVGYAACHWCHVMAHECFESPEIAAVMNELFVNIKVDREERPDVDTIYQTALALLGQQGGWPLTMFLTPEGEPFWGGTYFPPTPRFGRPGFPEVLRSVDQAYRDKPDSVAKNVTALKEALARVSQNEPGDGLPLSAIDQAAQRLVREIDPFHGGLGGAPKFPQPSILKLLWQAWKRTKQEPYRNAVELTLAHMCQGGIYDHLGGGFARYSVDERWLVPHFEKMLYDNAQLVDLLTWVWQDTKNPLFEQRLRETVAWTLREMRAATEALPPGGDPGALAEGLRCGAFASTLDADSEGEEGRFYTWDAAEIERLLGTDAAAFCQVYDVSPEGNWEGKTILNRSANLALGDPEAEQALAAQRAILFAARAQRVWPGWDDKVLADWNGLMIAALARAAPVFAEPAWLAAAERACAFIAETFSADGRLHHAWRHGVLKHPATLDDYAQMCEAALALHQATGRADYLAQAEAWVESVERHYADPDGGGYFLTADDTAQLIVRTKTAHDNATPAGNGTLAGVLAQLFYLTGDDRYRARAEAVVSAFSGQLPRYCASFASLINAGEFLQSAVQLVVIAAPDDPAAEALVQASRDLSQPLLVLQRIAPDDALPESHPAAGKTMKDGAATAYVCRGPSCSLPITSAEELARSLSS
jgi:uncharacterized protein YyaL (SSP411 family)